MEEIFWDLDSLRLQTTFASVAAGGAAFYLATGAVARVVAATTRASASSFPFATMIGLSAVTCGSVTASWISDSTELHSYPDRLFEGDDDDSRSKMASSALVGLLSFKVLGGRFASVLASDLRNVGAFGLRAASLPAAADKYGNTVERAAVKSFGKAFGCHSCGTRSASQWHADHQPPSKDVERYASTIWSKIRPSPTQRFYPHCDSCSNKQSTAVKAEATHVIHHWFNPPLRGYHATGALSTLALSPPDKFVFFTHAPRSSHPVVTMIHRAHDAWQER